MLEMNKYSLSDFTIRIILWNFTKTPCSLSYSYVLFPTYHVGPFTYRCIIDRVSMDVLLLVSLSSVLLSWFVIFSHGFSGVLVLAQFSCYILLSCTMMNMTS